jgi:hypothetical protein
MRRSLIAIGLLCALVALSRARLFADEAPVTGTVKSVDATKKILTVEASARGQTRQVEIDIKPETKIVRFTRGADGKGFAEQPATLDDIRPDWTVTVKTRHEGSREVAETVRVVHER